MSRAMPLSSATVLDEQSLALRRRIKVLEEENARVKADIKTLNESLDRTFRAGYFDGLRDAQRECEVVMSEDSKHGAQVTFTMLRIQDLIDKI